MPRILTCPECGTEFRASSIFADLPPDPHCPECGADCDEEVVTRDTGSDEELTAA